MSDTAASLDMADEPVIAPPALVHPTLGEPARVYEYVDAAGAHVFAVARFEPGPDGERKTFRQAHLEAGRWVWSLEGVQSRPLYRLPQVLAHIRSGSREPVYVAAGEKDVEALEAAGAVATCNPMGEGQGKWLDEHTAALAGAACVTIVADYDELAVPKNLPNGRPIRTGFGAALYVYRELAPVVSTLDVVRAAEGKDSHDHLTGARALGELVHVDIADLELEGLQPAATSAVGDQVVARRLVSQPWSQFVKTTPAEIDWLVRGLIARGAFVFVASPPKKGKTWVMIDLALAVVLARAFVAHFEVETPRPVLLVMLEGHRTAVRDRIGAMMRGAGVDPDSFDLDALHIRHKPPGINLSDPGWAADLRAEAADVDAALVGVDVLRAAARLKNENSAEDFALLHDNLRPLIDEGRVVALAHHFGKLTELSKERTPGERMTGSGAMYGAMDVGVFITGSEHGARVLRLEFDGRDAAMPDPVGVRLLGAGSGENGSLVYADAAHFVTEGAPDPAELKAPPSAIAAWVRDHGGHATPAEIRAHFDIAEGTLRDRRGDLAKLGIAHVGKGRDSRYEDLGDPADPAPADPAALRGNALRGQEPHEQAELTPHPADPAPVTPAGSETAQPSQNSHPADPALPTGEVPALRGNSRDAELDWS